MTSLNSSVIFWNEEEIAPHSILFISSGAVGDRLLFWQSTASVGDTQRTCGSHLPTTCSVVVGSPIQVGGPFGVAPTPDGQPSCKGRTSATCSSNTPSAQRHSAAPCGGTAPTTPGGNSNSGGKTAVASTEMIIEGVPVSSLLSLLHPSTNKLQHKIYVKLSTKVFVGVAFSLTKAVMETNGISVVNQSSPVISREGSLRNKCNYTSTTPDSFMDFTSIVDFLRLKSPLPPPKCDRNQVHVTHNRGPFVGSGKQSGKMVNQTVSSFAIVFALNETAPPCVQSYYTELARLSRNHLVKRTKFKLFRLKTGSQMRRSELYWQYLSREREKISAILDRCAGIISSGDSRVDAREHDDEDDSIPVSSLDGGNNKGDESTAPLLVTKRASLEAPDDDPVNCEKRQSVGGCEDPYQIYKHIAKRSPLCNELAQILEQVASSGRVNVKVRWYSVFFCLPFKAYAIMPFGLKMITTPKPCRPAIRPGAVWRAMERLRPYHTLLLTTRKRFLRSYTESFPIDVNQSLESFVQDLSPVSSLSAMSSRGHSQEECLRVALWLVYYGHAIIISPIVTNSAYTLAPLSHFWLQPKVVLQFAAQFSKLNFAEVLSSFSDYYTLQEHFDGESSAHFWRGLTVSERVDLVAWLLRRRLIVQHHTYLVSILPGAPKDHPQPGDIGGKDVCEAGSSSVSNSSTEAMFVRIHQGCGGALLRSALPTETDRQHVLDHYRSTVQHYPKMLHLFLRILTQLPAHMEELMFVESVDRQTLTNCVQLFSPFLTTLRLPDPVTACFAGVEWSY
ncbi:unnamed protein product [Mesocestoides corti]|uniref:GATOR complex protein NPRL3 n=1 Tax=Mesocestoides corti TaxID=53468 RepID=A0A0R3UAN4_MESCO|nr:unnamed protein product [Mesocestoides corti]